MQYKLIQSKFKKKSKKDRGTKQFLFIRATKNKTTKNIRKMKTRTFILIAICIFINSLLTRSQTNVSGGIYSNTTWTKINSPYIVTGNIVLFPGKTLTIEPGVEVKFDGYYNLEVRGTLVAVGTITDSISFVSNISLIKGAWDRINILNATHNACGWFKYCIVKYSSFGVGVECCWGNDFTYIRNSRFDNNNVASSSFAGWDLQIDSCAFTNNNIAITDADKAITNSTFTNNFKGIYCERFEARNCFFQNNDTAIVWFESLGSAFIDSCTIINNHLGVGINNGSITNNNISNNVIGITAGHISSYENGIEYYVPIKNNHICDNTQYNIYNYNSTDKNITQNCFCTTDSSTIESKLFDGYDDISLGLFNYDIYDSTCQNIIQSVYKVGTAASSVNNIVSGKPTISINPNPFDDFITIQFENEAIKLYSLRIYNMLGQKVQPFENVNEPKKIIDGRNLVRGIYLLQLIQDGIIIEQRRLIKV